MTDALDRLRAALADRYVLGRELGGGAMSRVFVAEETELGRQVVIKVLPPELAASVSLDRFRREIQLAASLQHPHIVPLLSAGQAGDLLYYSMPLVEGESLRARLRRDGELPVAEAVRILRDVADALSYAHAHGVVHRDIKPDNVLLSDGHALVTDFGVAKALDQARQSSLTSTGLALGTPAYMAPEQAAADPHTDHRADIYALGVLGYEMLTGRPPFTAPTAQAVVAAHMTQRRRRSPSTGRACRRRSRRSSCAAWRSARPTGRRARPSVLHVLESAATPVPGSSRRAGVSQPRRARRHDSPRRRRAEVARAERGSGRSGARLGAPLALARRRRSCCRSAPRWLAAAGGDLRRARRAARRGPRGRRPLRRAGRPARALARGAGGRALAESRRRGPGPERAVRRRSSAAGADGRTGPPPPRWAGAPAPGWWCSAA